jgi:hypothetical protein
LALSLSALIPAGCTTGAGGRNEAPAELHLFGLPVALNLDEKPGPDGIGVRVYASGAGLAMGVPISRGTLEVLMFDGIVGESGLRTMPPRHTWTLPAAALKPFASLTSLGTGYQLALRWEQDSPRTRVVTVMARYHSPEGGELQSAANTVSVALK